MEFQIDPKWTSEERKLHKERWDLQRGMDKIYNDDVERYHKLAKRYHELERILDDGGNY